MSCGVGRRHGSDLALLWLWCRLVAAAPTRPLAWEPPYATVVALVKDKKTNRKKRPIQRDWERKKKTNVKKISNWEVGGGREKGVESWVPLPVPPLSNFDLRKAISLNWTSLYHYKITMIVLALYPSEACCEERMVIVDGKTFCSIWNEV